MAPQSSFKVTKSRKTLSKKPKLATIAGDNPSSYGCGPAIPHPTPKFDLDELNCILSLDLLQTLLIKTIPLLSTMKSDMLALSTRTPLPFRIPLPSLTLVD